jgi:hypothetical protein
VARKRREEGRRERERQEEGRRERERQEKVDTPAL